MNFQLDTRLQQDCYKLAESEHCIWLLLNNCHFPWLIVVPKTSQQEIYLLAPELQQKILQDSNILSAFLIAHFPCDKLNVAAIGNVVKQLHWHVIARTESDLCWPGPVWGNSFSAPYELSSALEIQQKLQQFCTAQAICDLHFEALQ